MSINDLWHYVGGDLQVSATGDLGTTYNVEMGQQRVLRRLLTNPALTDDFGKTSAAADYIYHPEYGGAIPRMIGKNVDFQTIKRTIITQMYLEDCVSQTSPPVVELSTVNGTGVSALIRYTDKNTGQQATLSFTV